ncbi:MAG: UPF0104 family protein [Cyanophyceae cyanobacterium]
MKALKVIKPYLRWFILGGTLFFLLKAFKDRWQDVLAVQINSQGWLVLAIALLVTFCAHAWSGWVWTWILKAFRQPLRGWPAVRVYLVTNIAKYLPGNVWHFYGRIAAVTKTGGSIGVASLSVLLEPLLMAAAALLVALLCGASSWVRLATAQSLGLQILSLVFVLGGIHPRLLNPVVHALSRSKTASAETVVLQQYPFVPLLGEVGFVLLRGAGFLLTVGALMSITPQQLPSLLSAFSFAWLLGLIVPGAPGGLGVFEATIIALLNDQVPAEIILSTVAIFRFISIVAEAIAAGISWLGSSGNRASQQADHP